MKSHTVKSNAKRAARQLAAKYPGMFEPGEPSPAPGGWFPVINWTDAPSHPHAVPEEVRAACIILAPAPAMTDNVAASAMARAAAELANAPRVASTDEEIRARRAERRERVEREKVEGKRLPNGSKAPDTKAAKLLAMMKEGATMEEMSAATEWQHHTIRGFIAGTLRKRLAPLGKTITTEKIKVKPTRYLIAEKGASA